MKTFDLELRVKTFGSVLTWAILLEDATNPNQRVRDWMQKDDYRYKLLPNYAVEDDVLDVFAGCQGIIGGNITCEVLINGIMEPEKLISRVEDIAYARADYKIV